MYVSLGVEVKDKDAGDETGDAEGKHARGGLVQNVAAVRVPLAILQAQLTHQPIEPPLLSFVHVVVMLARDEHAGIGNQENPAQRVQTADNPDYHR